MVDLKTCIGYQMDLNKGAQRQTIRPALLQGDAAAHKLEISCVRNGEQVLLSNEAVAGYFVRADGRTVLIDGTVEGGKACIVLSAECYAVEGTFELVVRASVGGNSACTIYWGGGAVRRSRTDAVVDPGQVIPSLEVLLAKIADMEAATEAANAAVKAAQNDISTGMVAMDVPWSALAGLSEDDRKTVLEAARPVCVADVQAVFDGIPDGGSSTLTIEGNDYTLRRLGEVHDTLMVKDGALVLCHKVADDGTVLRTEAVFEAVACDDLTALFDHFELPCSVKNLLAGKLTQVSYAGCGAYLDGVHDDYEAMYRAHFIGDLCSCDVIQHGGTIYKANSGWLYVEKHNVDLTGCAMKIDAYNRYGTYWLNAPNVWELESSVLTALRTQMTEYSETWAAVETGFPANGLFVVRHPDAATRWNEGEVNVEDRVELVRHACDGRVHSTVIDAATSSTDVTFRKYPETQLTFRGCALEIDIAMGSVPMYFMRCERSNAVIRDFVINPTRRTTMNTGYRGAVFTLNECADIVMENIKGVNIAGRPRAEYPRGVAGYILNAVCVLDLTVRDCNLLGYWGCVGLNGAKEITFEGCELNRVDIHDYFRNLTIDNCRIYGQTINFGYGKGAVNISNCSVMTNWVHQIVNLRCDYGRYFEGEINISNVDCVYNGPTYFDIVSGVTMFSAESAANTGLRMNRYPTINVANVTLRLLADSTAGYVFNMPAALESAIQIADKRKVVEYVNVTAYDENGALLNLAACSLGGVVKDTAQAIKAAGAAAAAAQATADNALGKAVALEGEVSQLSEEIGDLKSAFDESLNGNINIPATWERGTLTTGGNYRPTLNYRVATVNKVTLPDDVNIRVADGFRLYYYIFGDTLYNSGWITSAKIPKGSVITMVIARTTEDETEIADIDYFVSQVDFLHNIKGDILTVSGYTTAAYSIAKALDLSAEDAVKNANYRIAPTGAIEATDESTGVSDKILCVAGDNLTYTLSCASGKLLLAVFNSFGDLTHAVAGTGYSNFISGTYTFTDEDAYAYVSGVMSRVRLYNLSYNSLPKTLSDMQDTLNDVTAAYPIIPGYWQSYLADKYPVLWQKDALIGSGGDSFVFITDVHYERNLKQSPLVIRAITDNTAVKTVFNGGDTLDEGDTVQVALEKLSTWQGMMHGIRTYNIVGNHDNNNYNSSNPDGVLTDGQYYGIMVKPAEQWIDTDGELYYCVDNASQKVRYICLAIEGLSGVNVSEGSPQKAWLETKLTELDAGWTIIVMQHRIWGSTTDAIAGKAQAVIDTINGVWDDIKADFVGIIAGHTHLDYSTTEATNGYLLIACNCDTNSNGNSGYTRTAGTASEQSFDVFYLDKTNKHLYAVRIGAGDTTVGSGTGIRDWAY